MRELKKYEKELETILNADKNNWSKFYLLMKEIEEKELYKEVNLNSFTAWVKDFSLKHKIHESVIWNRKKAGKVYESYAKVQADKGIEVAPLEEANVGVDALVLLDKISKKDANLGAELTQKALNKEITRDDLRTAYKTVRGDLRAAKTERKHKEPETEIDVQETVTAAKIVNGLNHSNWLGKECKKKHFKGAYELDKYKALTEFPVYTGTSKKSRRIDVLVAENITQDNHFSLNLHGVEIKVSKSDLINDMKYTEYAEYVNYLWLAIPRDLIEVAEETAPKSIGILIFDDGKIMIHRDAERLNPLKLNESLTTLSLRLI
ncbi:MmcB family DNA repair protein [Clostridium perfringens]|uniref:MmcB family DNA repair protein n=1 Tax=Clostridium perfringens TaxID=1502 RepID=UPI003F914CEE